MTHRSVLSSASGIQLFIHDVFSILMTKERFRSHYGVYGGVNQLKAQGWMLFLLNNKIKKIRRMIDTVNIFIGISTFSFIAGIRVTSFIIKTA